MNFKMFHIFPNQFKYGVMKNTTNIKGDYNMKKMIMLIMISIILFSILLPANAEGIKLLGDKGCTVEVPEAWETWKEGDNIYTSAKGKNTLPYFSMIDTKFDVILNLESTTAFMIDAMETSLKDSFSDKNYISENRKINGLQAKIIKFEMLDGTGVVDAIIFYKSEHLVCLTLWNSSEKAPYSVASFLPFIKSVKIDNECVFPNIAIEDLTGEKENKKDFDISVYEEYATYQYDKFTKEWTCHAAYTKKYRDANAVFGLQIKGNKTSINSSPVIYGWIKDEKNSKVLYEIKSVDILVDETVFSLNELIDNSGTWYAYLDSKVGKVFIDKLRYAKEIAVKYHYGSSAISFDIGSAEVLNFNMLSNVIYENDAWEYIEDSQGRKKNFYDTYVNMNCKMEYKE